MPLSAAEKQRRYKEKLKKDPEKYEEYKKKKRECYHAKKILVKDLTPKEHYNAKIIWKLRKKNLRQNKKNLNRVLEVTPPSSPVTAQDILENNPQEMGDMEEANREELRENEELHNKTVDKKRERGRKKIRRDRTKLYKENLKLKQENQKLKMASEKYKQRYFRQKRKHRKITSHESDEAKYNILTNAIKDRYQKIKKAKEKKLLRSIFENVAKPKRKEIMKETLGLTGGLRENENIKSLIRGEKLLKNIVQDFFLRDDVSRATAGKKETITKAKIKAQKRFLLDNMKNLLNVFKKENPNTKCSYYTFTKYRPFFTVKPSADGREMCLCKVHVNPVYKARVLKRKRIIPSDDLNVLITSTVCNTESQACMYGTCDACCLKDITHDLQNETENVKWQEWVRQEIAYEKNGRQMKAMKNIKIQKEDQAKELLRNFNDELKTLKKHVYNIKVQYRSFRQAVDKLEESEMVLVADFSENYNYARHSLERREAAEDYQDDDSDTEQNDEAEDEDSTIPLAKILTKPDTYNVLAGKGVRLECRTDIADAIVNWKRQTEIGGEIGLVISGIVMQNATKYQTSNNDLIIMNVTQADAGTYSCEVVQESPVKIQHQVQVLAKPKVVAVSATDDGKPAPGSDLTLTCNVTGNPAPKIIWSKMVKDQPNKRVSEGAVLTLKNVKSEDSGKYYCYAMTDNGIDTSYIDISVQRKPKMHVHRTIINSDIGVEAFMQCSVHEEEPVTIRWFKGNIEIVPTQYKTEGMHSNLTVTPQTEDDFGTYTCRAVCDFGEHHRSIELTQRPIVERLESEGNKLAWAVHSHQPLKSMEVQLMNTLNGNLTRLPVKLPGHKHHEYDLSYQVDSSVPPGNYEVVVKVENTKGMNEDNNRLIFELDQAIQTAGWGPLGGSAHTHGATLASTALMYLLVRML